MIGRAPQPAADHHLEAQVPAALAHAAQADVVERVAARSLAEAETAILNLRGRKMNSGWKVDHWRITSAQRRGSSISSAVAPA